MIRISIKQYVRLTAWTGVYNRHHKQAERQFDGVAANEATQGFSKFMDIPLYQIRSNVNTSLFGDFGNMNQDDYTLAESMQPTTNGLHVSITYQLSVKFIYGTCCANQPACTIPMFIHAPPLPSFKLPEAPQGWDPTVYDQSDFALPVPDNEMRPSEVNEAAFNPESQPLMPPSPPTPPPHYNQDPNAQNQYNNGHGQVPAPVPIPAPQPYHNHGPPPPVPMGQPTNLYNQ